jgi:hypothetical protein
LSKVIVFPHLNLFLSPPILLLTILGKVGEVTTEEEEEEEVEVEVEEEEEEEEVEEEVEEVEEVADDTQTLSKIVIDERTSRRLSMLSTESCPKITWSKTLI